MKKTMEYIFIAFVVTILAACASGQDLIKKRCESLNYIPNTIEFDNCVDKEVRDMRKESLELESNRADQFLPTTVIPGVN